MDEPDTLVIITWNRLYWKYNA